jgi:chromate transport protein ChrA
MAEHDVARRIPIGQLVRYYLRLGLVGFGGPVALVGQMEREMVGEKGWVTKDEMREGIAVCQSLPGPLAIQVGIWLSYLRGGFWGAWAGGWAFILPNFVIVAALAALYVHFGGLPSSVTPNATTARTHWSQLFRWKVGNPLLIATAAAIGLVAYPLLTPTWVFVK